MADTKTAEQWAQVAANAQARLDAVTQEKVQGEQQIAQLNQQILEQNQKISAYMAANPNIQGNDPGLRALEKEKYNLEQELQRQTVYVRSTLTTQQVQLRGEISRANQQAGIATTQGPPNTDPVPDPANPNPGNNTDVPPPVTPPPVAGGPEPLSTADDLTVPPGTDTEEEGGQAGLEEPEVVDDTLGLPPGAEPDEGPQTGLEEPPLVNEPLTTPDGVEEGGERADTGLSEPIDAGVNEARNSGGKNPNEVIQTTAIKKAPDWRFRIQLAPAANYLYKAPDNAGILTPLKSTDGVIFPYAPTINVTYTASYETSEVPHSNFKIYNYRNSSVENISITGDFTAQDTSEANYVLAVIHFFRSVTKMFYGKDQNPSAGLPPPLCYLTGYGDYAFDRHPVLITSFTLNYPNDVDYITATIDEEGNASLGGNQNLPSYSAPTIGTPTRLQRLFGAKLAPGGLRPGPPASSYSQNATTRVPTRLSITLNALPVVTRGNYSNRFSLKDYATGKLLTSPTKAGGIW